MDISVDRRDKQAADRRAYRLIEACENAVHAAGGRIIYDADLLDPDLYGCLIPTRGGRRTIIISDNYNDVTTEAFFLAHETAHFFDPTLIRYRDEFPDEAEQNRGEAVAHFATKILLGWYGMQGDVYMSWIDNRIREHTRRDKYYVESRDLYRRADAAACAVLPPEGQQWLWRERRKAGQPAAGVPLSERVGKRLKKWFNAP